MPKIQISIAKSVVETAEGVGIRYDMPELSIDVPTRAELSGGTAELLRDTLKARLSVGQDAEGQQHHLMSSTIRRRKNDMIKKGVRERWKRTKDRARAQQIRLRRRKGKLHEVYYRLANRWDDRYPTGHGSRGGTIAFVDSGLLLESLSAEQDGDTAIVGAPAARMGAVIVLERRGMADGVAPIVAVTGDILETALRAAIDSSVATWEGREPGLAAALRAGGLTVARG